MEKKKRKRRNNKKIIRAVTLSLALLILLCAAAYFLSGVAQRRTYRLLYPDIVTEMAAEYGVDPYLAAAVIHCESSNNKDAVSPVGAVGLMQIMPDTGAWIAEKLEMDDFTEERLFEPEVNVRMGCWYIDYLTDRFHGNMTLVLAAYNAGPGNVQKWLEDERISENGTLTGIPFPETERYIEKVQRAYEKYLTLYKKELS
ncbi:MAG: lytic transglycosylase domain-containing protein [Clostridia bacterium]|nr:lytic transglycosylase domain-containing protein [Clostridia bacterium]